MRNYARRLLLPTLALLGAVSITKAVYSWPDLFPSMLKALGNAIVDAMGVTSAESSSNIEVAYVFIVSLLLVLAVFAILRVTWAYFRNQK
jgi:hypothetical protein